MERKETNLRQADAIIKAEGILSEKNLEQTKNNEGNDVIRGNLVIQVDEFNFTTIEVYVNSKTKDGKDNKAYAGIQTVMDTFQSIAEVGVAEATRVQIKKGQLAPNTFFDQQGKEHRKVKYRSSYFNRIKNEKEHTFSATFEVEMVISSMKNEVYTSGEEQGTETGRVMIHGWVPTYEGIEPLILIAPAEDGIADAVLSTYEKGDTVKFFGNLVNNRIEQTKEIPVVIGKPRIETITSYVNELVIEGSSAAYEEDGNPAAYQVETITAAVAIRSEKLEEMKAKAMSKDKVGGTGGGINRPKTNPNKSLPF